MEREFEEWGYSALAEVSESRSSVFFEVWSSESLFFKGYIKWDGCSNWDFEHAHFPLHFCGRRPAEQFGVLLTKLYDWAAELMPEHSVTIKDMAP